MLLCNPLRPSRDSFKDGMVQRISMYEGEDSRACTHPMPQERARKNMSEDDKKKLLKYVAEVSVERPVLSVDEVVMAEGPQIVGWSKEKMSEALAKMYIKRFLQEVKDHQHKSAAEIREGFKQVTDLWELRAEANDASIDTRGKKRPWLTLHGYRIDLESAANAELLERLRNDEGIEFIDPGRGPSAFRFSFRPALGICDRVALRRVIDHAVYQGISHAELLPTKVQELNYMNKDADGAEYERHNTYPGVMRDLDVLLGVRVVRVFSRTTSDGKLIQLCDRCNAQLCHRCILKVQKELRAMLGLAEPNEGGGGAEGCQLQYQFPSHEPGDYFRLQARRGRGVPKAALIDAVNRAGKCVELPNGRWTWPPTEYGPHHVATCVCVEARRAALSAARCVSMARAYQTARNRVQKNMSLPVWHADYDDSPPRALLLTVGGICDKTIMSAFPPTEPGATESEQWFKALWMDQIVPRGDALQKELLKSQRRLEVDYAVRRMRREELRRRMAQAAQKPRKQIEKAFRKVTNSHLHASIFGDRAPKPTPA